MTSSLENIIKHKLGNEWMLKQLDDENLYE